MNNFVHVLLKVDLKKSLNYIVLLQCNTKQSDA